MYETSFHGIPHFHWDVIAKIIPGMTFVCLAWGTVLDANYANDIWNTLVKQWYLWFAVILLAYLLGMTVDCFTWPISSWQAKIMYKRLHKRDVKKDDPWSTALYDYATTHHEIPESIFIEKAQVESRAAMNLCFLLLFLEILILVLQYFNRLRSLAFVSLDSISWEVFLISMFAIAGLAWLMGLSRQGRRVWGVYALQRSRSTSTDSGVK